MGLAGETPVRTYLTSRTSEASALLKFLRRVWCIVIGHNWGKSTIRRHPVHGQVKLRQCQRCYFVGVWKHK